jgi:hypothetical protein
MGSARQRPDKLVPVGAATRPALTPRTDGRCTTITGGSGARLLRRAAARTHSQARKTEAAAAAAAVAAAATVAVTAVRARESDPIRKNGEKRKGKKRQRTPHRPTRPGSRDGGAAEYPGGPDPDAATTHWPRLRSARRSASRTHGSA